VSGGLLDQRERRGRAAHAVEVSDGGEEFGRSVRVSMQAREPEARALTRRERALPRTLQLVDDGEPPVQFSRSARIVDQAPRVRRLLPRQGGVAQLSAQLGVAADPLEERHALLEVVRGRELKCAARRFERVAVRVHGMVIARSGEKREPRPRRLLRCRPVLGYESRPGASLLEQLGQPPMQRAPAPPRDVKVDRLTGERVAKRGDARLDLDDDAERHRLVDRRLSRELCYEREVEPEARDACDLENPARVRRHVLDARKNGIANGIRDGNLSAAGELEHGACLDESSTGQERCAQLFHEERNALGSVVDRLGE
jgi:hypothetical protein